MSETQSTSIDKPQKHADLPDAPWARDAQDIIQQLQVTPDQGLDDTEVQRRRRQYGPNDIHTGETTSALSIFIDQFRSGMVALLTFAAVASFAVGETIDAVAILVVVVVNAIIGFFTEYKAIRSMEALEELATVSARVRRDGAVREIDAEHMVPGDIVIVDAGDVVSADMRLLESNRLQADEASLTGESVPVSKQVKPVDDENPLAERNSMLYRGTAVSSGSGLAVVTATGMNTELGLISSLTASAQEAVTPLEKRMDRLSHRLIFLTLAIVVLVAIAGLFHGRPWLLMMETAIALAVATVPEGLPIVATTALGRGMLRMAKNNALINRLSAVETLGATNVIAVDKTGTLTESRMTVTRLEIPDDCIEVTGEALSPDGEFRADGQPVEADSIPALRQSLTVGSLCNNASLQIQDNGEFEATGEPLEIALLVAGAKAGIDPEQLKKRLPEVREDAFDPELKMMATVHGSDDGPLAAAVKGAPEAVLDACTTVLSHDGETELTHQQRQKWIDRNEAMAKDGLRVLALAQKNLAHQDDDVYDDLTLIGLAGMIDPPRPEAKEAIARCQQAGIRFVMMTGDQPLTALNIAQAVGLIDEDHPPEEVLMKGTDLKPPEEMSDAERQKALKAQVFARVSPEQKLDLIALHQSEDRVIAMTGDGVNDAPALKKADIGVAMGQRGTQVAREASDMVLQDDQLETIVAAVEQGRVIFGNIRKFVLFLLSCNVGEVLVVGLAMLAGAPLPLLPLQILFLNLVTDVFPALALGVGQGDPHIMKMPPRESGEPVMTRRHWIDLAVYGTMITITTLAALFLAGSHWLNLGGADTPQEALNLTARKELPGPILTVSFLTLAAAQLWHVFDMRDRQSGMFVNEITSNIWIWGSLLLCFGLLVAAVELPLLAIVLDTAYPGSSGVLLILIMSIAPTIGGHIYIGIKNIIARRRADNA